MKLLDSALWYHDVFKPKTSEQLSYFHLALLCASQKNSSSSADLKRHSISRKMPPAMIVWSKIIRRFESEEKLCQKKHCDLKNLPITCNKVMN